jgi:prevent-host-death family protein
MSKAMSVADAKRRFSDVLGAVRHRGERIVIERRGTPVAAIVPLDDLAALEGKRGGLLALVGAFRDARELPSVLDAVVRSRSRQRPRRAPPLSR